MRRWSGVALCLTLVMTPVRALTEASELPAPDLAVRNHATMELFAPFFDTQYDSSTLVLLSSTTERVSVEIAARNRSGEVFPLGVLQLEPTAHRLFSLTEALKDGPPEFRTGSLVVRFFGEPEAVQSWLLMRHGQDLVELALVSAEEIPARGQLSFWPGSAGSIEFFLTNVGPAPVTVTATISTMSGGRFFAATLASGEQTVVQLSQEEVRAGGSIEIDHDGIQGSLAGAGLRKEKQAFERLPWLSSRPAAASQAHHAIELPRPLVVPGRAGALSFFQIEGDPQSVDVYLVDASTGSTVDTQSVRVSAGRVSELPMAVFARWLKESLSTYRLKVIAERPFFVSGTVRRADGTLAELAFFRQEDAHRWGSYPVLPPDGNAVASTLVNLGTEPAEIVGQLSWAGGTYAYGPVLVPAAGTHRMDLRRVIEDAGPDILGRTVPEEFEGGYFKWISRSGSQNLIARTEARPNGLEDRVGFNCIGGCCTEFPKAVVVPQSVEILPGESKLFQACVEIDTCNGTMGPYPTTPKTITAPYPFSWNGTYLGLSSPAEDTMEFTSKETSIRWNCNEVEIDVMGAGRGRGCKIHLKKSHNITEFWEADNKVPCIKQVDDRPSGKKCASCKECCSAIMDYSLCKGDERNAVLREHQICELNCETDVCLGG